MAKYATNDVDTSKFEGLEFPEPGAYHFILDHVIEENEKGKFEAHLSILSGTTKGQEGRSHREYFHLKPKAIPRLIQFAVALGLTTAEDIEAAQAQGDDVEIDWDQAVREGRQCCGVLAHGKNQDGEKKEFVELGFKIFACDDKRAKSIPLDRNALQDLAQRVAGKAPLKELSSDGGYGGEDDAPFDASDMFD